VIRVVVLNKLQSAAYVARRRPPMDNNQTSLPAS
jgi:hypothetical protein